MIENPAGLGYDFEKVLKTPKRAVPRTVSGFFTPAPPSMGRVRRSARPAARLVSSFHTLPAPLKTGPEVSKTRSIPA